MASSNNDAYRLNRLRKNASTQMIAAAFPGKQYLEEKKKRNQRFLQNFVKKERMKLDERPDIMSRNDSVLPGSSAVLDPERRRAFDKKYL